MDYFVLASQKNVTFVGVLRYSVDACNSKEKRMSQMPFDKLPEDPDGYQNAIERVKAHLRGVFGPGIHATSAVHGAIVDALEERQQGRTPSGLVRRAINKILDDLRRARVHDRVIADRARSVKQADDDPAQQASGNELYAALLQTEKLLSTEQQEIWNLMKQNMRYAEIARLLGKTESAIKMAASRIMKKLEAGLPSSYRDGEQ